MHFGRDLEMLFTYGIPTDLQSPLAQALRPHWPGAWPSRVFPLIHEIANRLKGVLR